MNKLRSLHAYHFIYIYILSVVALDETNISGSLHFSMQNIEIPCDQTTPLGGVTSTSANDVLCSSTFTQRHSRMATMATAVYIHTFRSLAVPTPPFQIKYFIC